MSKGGEKKGDKKVANSLVAVSCAAVLAVYSAGYARTKEAASQFEEQAERRIERRPVAPAPVEAAEVALVPAPDAPEATARVAAPVVEAPRAIEPVAASAEPEPVAAVVETPVAQVVETPAAAPVVAVVAPAPTPAPPPPPPPPPAPKWKDGSFTGWGTSRHGDIEATVIIEGGKIQVAKISECNTRYSCDVIDMLPPQVTQRQSADVDYVSRATESANAFYYAVVEALNKATPPK